MGGAQERSRDVSIIIPVLNKLQFTRQCLDRIRRNTGDSIDYEVIVVDNGSSDETEEWFKTVATSVPRLRYHRNPQNLGFAKGNNLGAGLSHGEYLVFLNNDTLVQPGWLSEMLRVIRSDPSVGIVGIKQLFPYTNIIYHTGVVFAPGGIPQHLYPHLDASLPHVNKEREYQAVTGACLMIERTLFQDCGGFDEAYHNGYEDTDLCLAAGQRGRKVVCCTTAFIYHYGQISEGRTATDEDNAARFARKWGGRVRVDRDNYLIRDRFGSERTSRSRISGRQSLATDCIYLADDLTRATAWTWVNVELATALADLGASIFVSADGISSTVPAHTRKRLNPIKLTAPIGGVQIKWSHYWPQHLNLELNGDVNLEFFVTNYFFGNASSEPWDYWTQCLRQNHRHKLPASEFCQSVLQQVGIPEGECHVLHHGYAPEIHDVEPPARRSARFRILTVTNSHDLGRYGTLSILDAYDKAFGSEDDVTLVVKDYGASSGDTTLRERLKRRTHRAPIEYLPEFTAKRELIQLYKSCDAFVSAHRGEGFGMKILDAMACGLPVITPLFGGPTSYCSPETSFPIDFHLAPVKDCIDSRSLALTNQPLWAEADVHSIATQIRRVYENRGEATAIGARGRASVLDRFSWRRIAERLLEISKEIRAGCSKPLRANPDRSASRTERSPYWLGLRVSVVIPSHNRKDKLLACLEALKLQSILAQEFEVLVIDDGSTDGTEEALASRRYPFVLRCYRQQNQGPGSARNLGIEKAGGELILFIGDDVIADERLLEEHLLAHSRRPEPGAAVLGHIDWPPGMVRNAVMDYICGDAALQFAYTLIPLLPALDHRFFYTSNISLKRDFLVTAADAGIRFDPCFRYAAFEDSEFAFRLIPRGLEIRYVESARAIHDHWMDLDSFALREYCAGQMAVVFYRKHPGQDEQLQVQWLAGLNASVSSLSNQVALLQHLETFDNETDSLLRALARSLEALLAIDADRGGASSLALSVDGARPALHHVLRIIFDVERTRGKVREWFAGVDDEARIQAAQTLATVRRKIEFFNHAGMEIGLTSVAAPLRVSGRERTFASRELVRRVLRRLVANPLILPHLVTADRFVEASLQRPGRQALIERYRSVRKSLREVFLTL
jgi:GT2 family glycosyltransferase/glycosyltransferase involved in cell wall biosynthesis